MNTQWQRIYDRLAELPQDIQAALQPKLEAIAADDNEAALAELMNLSAHAIDQAHLVMEAAEIRQQELALASGAPDIDDPVPEQDGKQDPAPARPGTGMFGANAARFNR